MGAPRELGGTATWVAIESLYQSYVRGQQRSTGPRHRYMAPVGDAETGTWAGWKGSELPILSANVENLSEPCAAVEQCSRSPF